MTLTGADISQADGQNASGVCNGHFGYNMTLDHLECYGSQEGIRGLGGNVTISNCYVHHNGCDSCNSTGCTHNVYLNEDTGGGANLTSAAGNTNVVTNSVFRKALFAHEYKTRQPSLVTSGCVFDSSVIPGSQGNYSGGVTQLGGNGNCVEVANGGNWTSTNDIFIKGPGASNHVFISFNDDAEGIGGWKGNAVLHNPIFVNLTGTVTHINVVDATMTVNNPTFIGTRPDGNYTVTGTATDLPANTPIPFPGEILALFADGTYPS